MPLQTRTRWKRVAAITGAVAAALWGVSLICVVLWGRKDSAYPAGAIVVMGAAQYVGRPSPVLQARLTHAVDLWKRGMARHVVLTGGTGTGDTISEAAVGRQFMVSEGVPDSAILLETRGRTTAQSLQSVAALMAAEQIDTVILVSDPFHMLRLWIVSRRMGLTPLLSPTHSSPISRSWKARWGYRIAESFKAPLSIFVSHADSH